MAEDNIVPVVGVGIAVYFELGIDIGSEAGSGPVAEIVADRSAAEAERYWVKCCFAEENRRRFVADLR